jgi:hypothetical protein
MDMCYLFYRLIPLYYYSLGIFHALEIDPSYHLALISRDLALKKLAEEKDEEEDAHAEEKSGWRRFFK